MRFPSIDVLRTIAIFLMVVVHFVENLSGNQTSRWFPAGFAAPFFSFLTGMSFYLWVVSQARQRIPSTEVTKRSVRRGLCLIGIGFVFNVLVWMPEDTYNWDVLTFIGAVWLLLTALRNLPPIVFWVVGLCSLLSAPALRAVVDYNSLWAQSYFDPDMTLTDVSLGFLVTGYFPFLPWLIVPLLGYSIARVVFLEIPSRDQAIRRAMRIALCGASLIGLSFVIRLGTLYATENLKTHILTGWTMFPPSIEYLAETLGIVLLVFAMVHRFVDLHLNSGVTSGLLKVATVFSRHSLTMYLLHHVVHLWPLWLCSVYQGHEPTYLWQKALPIQYSLPMALVFLFMSYFLLRWMDQKRLPGAEGWLKWLCE